MGLDYPVATLPYVAWNGRKKHIPPIGAPDSEIAGFQIRTNNFYSVYRNRQMSRMCSNLWYYLGRQWIQPSREIYIDQAVRGYAFQDIHNNTYSRRPQPVTNFIGPACDNEISRLANREYTITVPADSDDPRVIGGAKLAEQIAQKKYDEMNWNDIRDRMIQYLVVCGSGGIRSAWDTTIRDTMVVAAPDAQHCLQCGTVISSTQIPALFTQQFNIQGTDSLQQYGNDQDSDDLRLVACPNCGALQTLLPYEPAPDEAAKGVDFFGRPLGLRVFRGKPTLEVVMPTEFFPENGGVNVNKNKLRRNGRCIPVDIDYLEERWPEHSEDFRPVEPTILMRTHPVLGEWNYLGRFNYAFDLDIYDNHMMMYETTVEPYVEEYTDDLAAGCEEAGWPIDPDTIISVGGKQFVVNDGRHIISVGDEKAVTVLVDSPLYIPYEVKDEETGLCKTGKVKKVEFAWCHYKPRPSEFWADGLPDIAKSPQNRINAFDARLVETLDRMGNPNLLVPDDMDLTGPEWRQDWGVGKILKYARSTFDPSLKPEILQGATLPEAAWQERNTMVQNIQTLMNWTLAEQGNNPPSVKNTSQLKLLGDNADAHRGPIERGIGWVIEKTGRHFLHMLYALRTDQDTYTVDAKGAKVRSIKYFKGADLLGQFNVKVEKSAGVERDIYQSTAASEALQDGVYNLADPVARKKFLELKDLPEVNEQQNAQISKAQEVGVDFIELGKVYACDPTIQDCGIFFHVLGYYWFDDTVEEMQRQVCWNDKVLAMLAGWPDRLTDLQYKDAQARQYYGDLTQDPQALAQAQQNYQKAIQAQQLALQAHKQSVDAAQQHHDTVRAALDDKRKKEAGEVGIEKGDKVEPTAIPAAATPQPPQLLPLPPVPLFLPPAIEAQVYNLWCTMLGQQETPIQVMPGEQAVDPEVLTLHRLLRFRAVIEAYRLYAAKMATPMPAPGGVGAPQMPGMPGSGGPPPSNQQGPQMPTGPLG